MVKLNYSEPQKRLNFLKMHNEIGELFFVILIGKQIIIMSYSNHSLDNIVNL